MPGKNFKATVDEGMRLINFRLKGSQPSSFYRDSFIEAYAKIDEPWKYNRLLDYRHFQGLIEADDVERLARHWAGIVEGKAYKSKIAVLTADVLTPLRATSFGHLFPNEVIRTFDTLHAALDWLSSSD